LFGDFKMNLKILAGLFVILGMAGMGFAFYGTDGGFVAPADFDADAMNAHMETCHAYFTGEEVSALKEEMHSAIEAGDEDKIAELKEQIAEDMPEGCRPIKALKEKNRICHAYFTSEEVSVLRAELKDAVEAGDYETAKEIKEEIAGGMPEGCKPRKMIRRAKIIHSLPEDVIEQFKAAWENKDFETLRALKEEYFPKPPFEKPEPVNN